MNKRNKNIICISAIIVACAVPAIVYASTDSDTIPYQDNTSYSPSNMAMTLVEESPYYTEEDYAELFLAKYNNPYYKDIFENVVHSGISYDINPPQISEAKPESDVIKISSDYVPPVNFSQPLFNGFYRDSIDDNVVYLNQPISDLDEVSSKNITLSDNAMEDSLLAIIQNGYPNKIVDTLSSEDMEFGTAVAYYAAANGLSALDVEEMVIIPDNETDEEGDYDIQEDYENEILDYIFSLMNSEYEEKNIEINFSNDVVENEEMAQIVLANNSIETNFEDIQLDIYRTDAFFGLNVISQDLNSLTYANGDEFSIWISTMELDQLGNRYFSGFIAENNWEAEPRFVPSVDEVQLIMVGDDISTKLYTDDEYNSYYICQDESRVFFEDLDTHPEDYVDRYQKQQLIITSIYNDSKFIASEISFDLYQYNEETDEYKYVLRGSTNTDGEYLYQNIPFGQYRIITTPEFPNYYNNVIDFEVTKDESSIDVIETTTAEIALNPIQATIAVTTDQCSTPMANSRFLITNAYTQESFEVSTNSEGIIELNNIESTDYQISALEGEFAGWGRVFYISDFSEYNNKAQTIDIDFSEILEPTPEDGILSTNTQTNETDGMDITNAIIEAGEII